MEVVPPFRRSLLPGRLLIGASLFWSWGQGQASFSSSGPFLRDLVKNRQNFARQNFATLKFNSGESSPNDLIERNFLRLCVVLAISLWKSLLSSSSSRPLILTPKWTILRGQNGTFFRPQNCRPGPEMVPKTEKVPILVKNRSQPPTPQQFRAGACVFDAGLAPEFLAPN